MDEVDCAQFLHLREIEREGVDGSLEFLFRVAGDPGEGLEAVDVQVADVFLLRAPAMDFDLDLLGELQRQVFDVNARSPVNIGRVFTSHQAYAHGILRLRYRLG